MTFIDRLAKAGLVFRVDSRAAMRAGSNDAELSAVIAPGLRLDKVMWQATNREPMALAIVEQSGRVFVLRNGDTGVVFVHAPDGVISNRQRDVMGLLGISVQARAESPSEEPVPSTPEIEPDAPEIDGEPRMQASDEEAPVKKKAAKKKAAPKPIEDEA